MTKQRISITLDEETLKLVEEALTKQDTSFRNRSHAIEFIVNKFLKLNEARSRREEDGL